jgi:D-sedoheptulose 7-phosphate isomerase
MSLESKIAQSVATLQALAQIRPAIDSASALILDCLRSGGRLLICGNGGSAAEAAHFSTELVGRYDANRRSLPAVALSADGSLVTCIGNDYGFEQAFARQIEGLGRPGDLVVVLTSSGKSPNILAALRQAQKQGLKSLAFLGRGGGPAKGLATCDLIIPGDSGASAQEAHLVLIHYFCDLVDAAFK